MKKYLITRKYLVEANSLVAAESGYGVETCIFHKCVEVEGDMDVDN